MTLCNLAMDPAGVQLTILIVSDTCVGGDSGGDWGEFRGSWNGLHRVG